MLKIDVSSISIYPEKRCPMKKCKLLLGKKCYEIFDVTTFKILNVFPQYLKYVNISKIES